MKTTNFKLKIKDIDFTSTRFMDSSEKLKVYKDFVKFLNNHFKRTTFSKRLYEYFHQHCGFIAHYNINGFYGEYFSTPMMFHKIKTGYAPSSEYIGYVKKDNTKSVESSFVDIGIELYANDYSSLGGFYSSMMNNRFSDDYEDLNKAIRLSFNEYQEAMSDIVYAYQQEKEIEVKTKQENKIKEVTLIEEDSKEEDTFMSSTITNKIISQTSLFDFI